MGYLIGTDEAGYGPNLGPLVISATVWSAPDGVGGDDLFERLRGVIGNGRGKKTPITALTPGPSPKGRGESSFTSVRSPGMGEGIAFNSPSPPAPLPKGEGSSRDLPVFGDSKLLYTPSKGLRQLERGLWAAWELLGWRPRRWRELWERLAPETRQELADRPWYRDYDADVPSDLSLADDGRDADGVAEGFSRCGIALCNIRSRVVFPEEWNALLESHGSKGAALSHLTLELIVGAMRCLPRGESRVESRELEDHVMANPQSPIPNPSPLVSVLCDKHGGRDHYLPLLYHFFSDEFIEVRSEGRAESVYQFGPTERRIEFRFRAKAESALPAALASMVSKYLREQAMRPFNKFWTLHVPDLAPTAGYPLDARRFMQEIHARKEELGIGDGVLWRKK
jgi:hypothetical protein